MDKTELKLDKACKLINAFMQWFLYHHLDYGEDVKRAIEEFSEV